MNKPQSSSIVKCGTRRLHLLPLIINFLRQYLTSAMSVEADLLFLPS